MQLGIDIGGTNTKFAIIENQHIIFHQVIKTDFAKCEQWIKQVLKTAKAMHKKYPFKAVAIASAGVINHDGLVIGANAQGKNYIGTNWKKLFNDYFQKPIFTFACNDAHALAYYVLQKHESQSLCLTLGTGLGVSLILNAKVYRGDRFLAGQVGSLPWSESQNLDQVFSATNLHYRISKLYGKDIDFHDLHTYYAENPTVKTLVDHYVKELSKLIAFTCTLLELEQVIIGGGLSYSGPFLLKLLRTHLKNMMPAIWIDLPIIKYAKAKNDANILGLFNN